MAEQKEHKELGMLRGDEDLVAEQSGRKLADEVESLLKCAEPGTRWLDKVVPQEDTCKPRVAILSEDVQRIEDKIRGLQQMVRVRDKRIDYYQGECAALALQVTELKRTIAAYEDRLPFLRESALTVRTLMLEVIQNGTSLLTVEEREK